MLDIGWAELFVIAVVAIIVVGPKDLPRMLRMLGQAIGKFRSVASDFQGQFNDVLREAELDDIRENIENIKDSNPVSQLKDEVHKAINPLHNAAKDFADEMKSSTDMPVSKSAGKTAIEKNGSVQKTDTAHSVDESSPTIPNSAKKGDTL